MTFVVCASSKGDPGDVCLVASRRAFLFRDSPLGSEDADFDHSETDGDKAELCPLPPVSPPTRRLSIKR